MGILANRIVTARQRKQWTQGQLALYAKIEQSYLSMIEGGKRTNISLDKLTMLAHALDTSTDYLIGLTDDPQPLPVASSNPMPADVAEVAYRIQQLSHPVRERLIHTIVSMIETTEAVEEEMKKE